MESRVKFASPLPPTEPTFYYVSNNNDVKEYSVFKKRPVRDEFVAVFMHEIHASAFCDYLSAVYDRPVFSLSACVPPFIVAVISLSLGFLFAAYGWLVVASMCFGMSFVNVLAVIGIWFKWRDELAVKASLIDVDVLRIQNENHR